jgi:acetyltransferase-like isoleucine patch superfamily enzyme
MKRKWNKLIFHSLKFIISLLVYFDSRRYMFFYTKLLRHVGVNLKGEPRFIAKSAKFDDFHRITLGDRLVVSLNVYFLTHDYSFTTALIAIDEKPQTDIGIYKNIVVGDNVFIGMNSLILPGTTIGNNVIVGAGSVVRGNVPDYSIITGNPAHVAGDIREYARKVQSKADKEVIIDKK